MIACFRQCEKVFDRESKKQLYLVVQMAKLANCIDITYWQHDTNSPMKGVNPLLFLLR